MFKILVFGISSGFDKLKRVIDYNNVKIVAIIDNDEKKWDTSLDSYKVISPQEICKYTFDFIVITSQFYDQIMQQLLSIGIDKNKIINFFSANFISFTRSASISLYDMTKLSDDRLIINNMEKLGRKRLVDVSDGDYVRYSTLELLASEIYSNNIEGSVAELGVYKGAFARKLNEIFYDRYLYLFDTFEGFNKNDVNTEIQQNYSKSDTSVFSNTSVEKVIQSMPHPENCIIKKGYFPDTSFGIEDTFAFVSIDADLFNPTYEGLKYFYPRLASRGYIMVHDYNNVDYLGAKEAVKQFCTEFDVSYFPVSDICGSVCISK
jgi:O-methyltransferase